MLCLHFTMLDEHTASVSVTSADEATDDAADDAQESDVRLSESSSSDEQVLLHDEVGSAGCIRHRHVSCGCACGAGSQT